MINGTRVAIIEDEYPAARLLSAMIHELRPDWQIDILPGTIDDSVKWFETNRHPDLVFLDIQLNDGNSFIFIEKAKPESMIVFTTAYDEYAIRAFSVNSIDYILKPVHKERLQDAICKFEKYSGMSRSGSEALRNIEQMLRTFGSTKQRQFRTRFLIAGPEQYYTIQVSDIAYFYSEEKISFAVTKDRKTHMLDIPLSRLEEQLDSRQFFRANRQFILSAGSVRRIYNYFGGKVIVDVYPEYAGTILVSREKVPQLKIWLNE